MDTGLNNTNKLHLALNQEVFKDVEWIIEATSQERFGIWKDFKEKYKWEQICTGYSFVILELEVKPVGYKIKKQVLPINIEFFFAMVEGHKIAFYDSPSLLSHHGYIEAFLITYFQRTHDKYSKWNYTDATNAHNCLNYLDTVDVKPRKTTYKPSSFNKQYHIFEKL